MSAKRRRRNRGSHDPSEPEPRAQTQRRRDERRQIRLALQLLLPTDEPPPWVSPAHLNPPPHASEELAYATADVFLNQANLFMQMLSEIPQDKDTPATTYMEAFLGCAIVNLEDTHEIVTQLLLDEEQDKLPETFQRLTGSLNQLMEQHEAACAAYANQLETEAAEQQAAGLPMPGMTRQLQYEARLRAEAEAMRHCAWKSANAPSKADSEAYTGLLFRLYHSALERHQPPVEPSDEPADWLPDHTPTAQQSFSQISEIHQEQLTRLNQAIPTELGPAFSGLPPAITEKARAIQVEPNSFAYGVISDNKVTRQPGHDRPIQLHCTYVAYYHEGVRHVQGLADPFPPGYPRELAQHRMCEVARNIDHPDPNLEIPAVQAAVGRAHLAAVGAHSTSTEALGEFVKAARRNRMSTGAITQILEATAQENPLATESLIRMAGLQYPPVNEKQARAVIATAKNHGMDQHQLASLAQAMKWPEQALNINTPNLTEPQVQAMLKAASNLGLDPEALQELEDSIQLI